jgi:protocatechuate 3,4-dioxygenase beta subunit
MKNTMKQHFPLAWTLLISLMLPFISLHSEVSVRGKVVEFTSAAAMTNVKVILSGYTYKETTTDENGVYEFLNVSAGQYQVEVEPPSDYIVVSVNPLEVAVDNADVKANFSLGIPGSIIGHVTDSLTHLPLANANVEIMRGNHVVASVLTDEHGNYQVSGLIPRPYIVRVKMSTFPASLQLAILPSNQTVTVDFILQSPPGKVMGQIINVVTGEPIANATIDIVQNGIVIHSIQSNEDGTYNLSEIIPGSYEIKVAAPRCESTSQSLKLLSNQTLMANFALESFGSVVGQVVHAFTGQPIAGASVGMWQNQQLSASTHTDANGHFSLIGLGHYQVVVQASNFHNLEKEVQLTPAQTTTLNINLVCFEPLPPKSMRVKVTYKTIAHQVNRIHGIKWEASPDSSVSSYRLYRDGKCIAEVAANADFVFYDKWRSGKEKVYRLTAVNSFGQESAPLSYKMK